MKFGYSFKSISSSSKKHAEWKKSLIIRAKYEADNRTWKLSNITEIPDGIQRVSSTEIEEITADERERQAKRHARKRKAE